MVDIAVLESKLKDLIIQREVLGNSRYFMKCLEYEAYLRFYGINYSIKVLAELIAECKEGRDY